MNKYTENYKGRHFGVLFKSQKEKDECRKSLKSLKKKTGLYYAEIFFRAIKLLDEKIDDRGNLK